jgi:Ser/Thr protein kinase RdoA (MazF antagonist)
LLPIAELVRVARLLDDDHHWSTADAAARLWGRNSAVFVRSSASHVFLADDLVLRMAPFGTRQADAVARSATTAERLHGLGAPVPRSVASTAGRLVEEVHGMVVTALHHVPGRTYDDDELTPEVARLWGRTLARFHTTGYTHGDPEPDNLVVDGETATFVDLDDAGRGDPVEDLAFALRGWTPPGGSPDLGAPVVAAFLHGYGGIDHDRLAEAARTVQRRTLASYQEHLTSPADPDWPEWAQRLHATIVRRAGTPDAPP